MKTSWCSVHSRRCLITAGLLFPTTLSAQGTDNQLHARLAAKADSLWSAYASATSPGCTAGVLQAGRIVFRTNYGMADIARGVPIGGESVFPVQSMQKMFLAYAVLRLEQRGRIGLDDPVRKYLPYLTNLDSGVTVGRLIQHTSGLPDVANIAQFLGWQDEEPRSRTEWVNIIGQMRGLTYAPGTHDLYSNASQILLPAMIEAVTGKPITTALQELVFTPLRMAHSSYRRSDRERAPTLVTPYRVSNAGHAIPAALRSNSLQTTADDILAWADHWLNPRSRQDSALVSAMRQRSLLPSGRLTRFGHGLESIRYRGTVAWFHGGDSENEGHSMLILWPAFNAAVVVLCNSGGIEAQDGAVQLSDLALEQYFTPAAATSPGSSSTTGALAGLYFGYDGGPALRRFRARGDTLSIEAPDGTAQPLLRRAERSFALPDEDVTWIFRADTAWRREGLATVPFIRVADAPSVRLDQLAGCYQDAVYHAIARLQLQGDRLLLHWGSDTTGHELAPRFTDGFTDGFAWLHFRRDATGQGVRLTVHQNRVWRMDFTRLSSCNARPDTPRRSASTRP